MRNATANQAATAQMSAPLWEMNQMPLPGMKNMEFHNLEQQLQDIPGRRMPSQPAKSGLRKVRCRRNEVRLSIPRKFSPITQRQYVDDADLGWAAGLMDGEGCVHIAKQTYGASGRRPTYRLRVYITQVDDSVLKEFEWIVGISGRLYGPKPKGKQNRTCHTLVYDGIKAFQILERIRTHLRRKRQQAELAFEFRAQCDIHRHPGPNGCPEHIWEKREWFYERMSDLKKV